MLSIKQNSDGNYSDNQDEKHRQLFQELNSALDAFFTMLQKDFAETRRCRPTLITCNMSQLEEGEALHSEFNYMLHGQKLSFNLPIFHDLTDKHPALYLLNSDPGDSIPTINNIRPRFYKGMIPGIFNASRRPGGILSITNLLNLMNKIKKQGLLLSFFNALRSLVGTLSIINLIKLVSKVKKQGEASAASFVYLTSILTNRMSKKLSVKLNAVFDEIEKKIEVSDKKSLSELYFKLEDLEKKHGFIFKHLPGNSDLKWKLNYLKAYSAQKMKSDLYSAEDFCEIALSLSSNPDKKFLVLKNLVNILGIRRNKWIKNKTNRSFSDYEKDHKHPCYLPYQKKIEKYIAQVPRNAPLYQANMDFLNKALDTCLGALVEGKYKEAMDRFDKLSWGDFGNVR